MNQRVPQLDYRPTMPTIVRRAAATFGDSDFIVMDDRRISFRQAELASRQLAKVLLAAGAGKGTRIAIQLLTGPEWAVAWIAATRIGALAMPLSTVFRPRELHRALRLGDVDMLIAPRTVLGRDHENYLEEAVPGLAGTAGRPLRLAPLPYLRSVWILGDSNRPWAERLPLVLDPALPTVSAPVDGVNDALLAEVESEVTPADLMTVVFTSGTTADPKAVVHTHGSVIRKVATIANGGLEAIFGGRVLCYMPFFWIGGVQNVAGALQSGAALLAQERLDPQAALALAERERATSISGNSRTLRAVWNNSTAYDLSSLTPSPPRPWGSEPNARGDMPVPLGMTETMGVWAGVEGFEYRVIDRETGQPVPDGREGEFHVRGYGLMKELYKREREETFTIDGWYPTRDYGYVEEGLVYHKGRLSDMIKVMGANVAPREVEAVLEAMPEIRLSVVVGLPHQERGQEVAAALVAAEGHVVDVAQICIRARRELSPYKVPTFIDVLSEAEIPYMATSKVDRRAIADLLASRRKLAAN